MPMAEEWMRTKCGRDFIVPVLYSPACEIMEVISLKTLTALIRGLAMEKGMDYYLLVG